MASEELGYILRVGRDADLSKIKQGRIKALYTEASTLYSGATYNRHMAVLSLMLTLSGIILLFNANSFPSYVYQILWVLTGIFLFLTLYFAIAEFAQLSDKDEFICMANDENNTLESSRHQQRPFRESQVVPPALFQRPPGLAMSAAGRTPLRNFTRLLSAGRHRQIPQGSLWSDRSPQRSQRSSIRVEEELLPGQIDLPDPAPVHPQSRQII